VRTWGTPKDLPARNRLEGEGVVSHIPDFLRRSVASRNFTRLSLKERRTRRPVQTCVQEIRGISRKTSERWGTRRRVAGIEPKMLLDKTIFITMVFLLFGFGG
jgi:hypothetical protein